MSQGPERSHLVALRPNKISALDPHHPLHGPAGPFGCSLEDLQVEAEKAMRELSGVAAKIAVSLPNETAD